MRIYSTCLLAGLITMSPAITAVFAAPAPEPTPQTTPIYTDDDKEFEPEITETPAGDPSKPQPELFTAGLAVGPQMTANWNTSGGYFDFPFSPNPAIRADFGLKAASVGWQVPADFGLGMHFYSFISKGEGLISYFTYSFPLYLNYTVWRWGAVQFSWSGYLGPGVAFYKNEALKKDESSPSGLAGLGGRFSYTEYHPNHFYVEVGYHGIYEFTQSGISKNTFQGLTVVIGSAYRF